MTPTRNVLHVFAFLAYLGLSSGCNSGCPIGTINEGSTCRSPQTSSEKVDGAGNDPANTPVQAGESGSTPPKVGGGSNDPTMSTGMAGASSNTGRGMIASPISSANGGGGADNAAAGSAGSANLGASAGAGSSDASSASSGAAGSESRPPQGEACSPEGAVRCAQSGMGARESCRSGIWTADSPCPDGNTCATSASGPACQPLSAVCAASGQPVACDSQGTMLMCNPDGTASMLATCRNAALCAAGLASGRCASCMPGMAMCNGKNLERCSTDGSGFQVEQDCKSAPLCDMNAGKCKPATCEAGSFTCNGDSLDQCNPDMTGYTSRRCGPGLCDANNKACMMCKPGSVTCSGATLVTCDPTGQRMDRNTTCAGEKPICDASTKQCVQCKAISDCSTDNACATADRCNAGTCSLKPKYSAPSTAGNGTTVRSGMMNPDPIYVVYGNALFWISSPDELNAYYGGEAAVTVTNASISGRYSKCPTAGTLIRERGDPHIYVSTGSALVWVKSPDYLAQCPWTYYDVPAQSLHNNTQWVAPAGNCPVRDN